MFMHMSQLEALSRTSTRIDGFDYPTLDEIVSLWRSYQASGLEPAAAWDAIAAGMALDIAFAGHIRAKQVEQ
jgi:hypothetical protein